MGVVLAFSGCGGDGGDLLIGCGGVLYARIQGTAGTEKKKTADRLLRRVRRSKILVVQAKGLESYGRESFKTEVPT